MRGEVLMVGAFYTNWSIPDWVSVVRVPFALAAQRERLVLHHGQPPS